MVDQSLDALDRRAASRGMLNSGNTSLDTIDYVSGVANQEYGSYLDRLFGQQQFGAGIAGQRAGIQTGTGAGLAGIATQAGTQGAAIKTGLGEAKYGHYSDLGDMKYANTLAKAGIESDYELSKENSGSNIAGLVKGGVSLGAKLLAGGL